MPSCGKTTVGSRLSQLTGKSFVDTDVVITERIGMPISEYFAQYGEAEFRRVESLVIKEISQGNNLIIATGGGAVLNPDNIVCLKQNGQIYFIDRHIDLLCPTGDRPLSANKEAMKKRYEERYEIYLSTCDRRIDGNGKVEDVACLICKEYEK